MQLLFVSDYANMGLIIDRPFVLGILILRYQKPTSLAEIHRSYGKPFSGIPTSEISSVANSSNYSTDLVGGG